MNLEKMNMANRAQTASSGIQALITEHEASLQKQIRALEIVNDAYEYGDYSRDEWLKRKRKWEEEIFNTKNTLYDLQRQAKSTVQITNADRQAMLTAFYEISPIQPTRPPAMIFTVPSLKG